MELYIQFGKEKAIIKGFFGNTVNIDIVFLFVNKNGKKYYINYDRLKSSNGKNIEVGKFYELKLIEHGRSFSFTESKKNFDEEVINKVKQDKELSKNIQFNKTIMKKEFNIQIDIRKKKKFIFDIITLLMLIILYSFTVNIKYSIPFVIAVVIMSFINIIHNKKMVKILENLQFIVY